MRKLEAAFQTKFNAWLRLNWRETGAFELKQTEYSSIRFSRVKEHQIHALQAAKHGFLVHKLPDDTRSYKPFDCFSLKGVPAYVVIKFPKNFYGIDVDVWLGVSRRGKLTEDEARKIAAFSG